MVSDKPVLLGLMPPLTGLDRIHGPEILRAGQLAAMEVNENGGLLGRPLELVVEDDGSLPPSAVAAAEKLVNHHGCLAIIGNLLSNARIAVAYRVAEPQKVPMLNFSFYEGSIFSRYFFHFAALPNQQIAKMIPYMQNRYGPKMFFAGNNYEWPRGSIDAAKKVLHAAGGEVVGEEYCPIGVSEEDIRRLLSQVARSRADVFVPYFAGTDQVTLLTQFAAMGLKEQMAVVMGHYDEAVAGCLPPEVRAGYYSSNTYFMSVDTDENRRVLNRLRTMPGVTALWPEGNGVLTNFGEGAYLCVKAFAQAVNEAGTLDREALIDTLETITVTSPQGSVTMDPATHHARVNTFLARCDTDGRFAIEASFGAIDPQIPERYSFLQIDDRSTYAEDIRLKARIMEHMAEGVCLVRATDGIIVYVNKGFETMFAYDRGELIGCPLVILYAPPPGQTMKDIVDEMGRHMHKGFWEGDVRNIRKDGSSFWCHLTQSVMTHGFHGEVWIGLHRDITERKQAEEELCRHQNDLEEIVRQRTKDLEKALEAAEAATLAKQTFLVTMSHEIRTPMNGVLGMADLISQTELTEKQRHYVSTISSSGRTLLRIINDILDIAKIQSNKFFFENLGFDMQIIVQDVCDLFVPRAGQNGLEFRWQVADDVPPYLLGDPYRLNQILFNLLDNAFKFTERGQVSLSVTVEEDRETDVLLSFRITDTGIGILPEYKRRIFQHFTQADSSMARRYGGTGLGLAIAQQLVHRMDGQLLVESELGQGSTFRFTVSFGKLRPGENQEISVGQQSQSSIADAMRFEGRILLVEDNRVNQEVAMATLELFGCQVTVASNGQQALSVMYEASQPFDMIFMDCEMPILDGFETTRQLRQWERQTGRPRIPIVALTAHVLTESRQQCLAAGMDDYVFKPFNQKAFGMTLHRWLHRAGGEDKPVQSDDDVSSLIAASQKSSDVGDMVLLPVLDQVALGRIQELDRKGDSTLFAKMVGHYLERTPELLGDLRRALENRDHGKIRFAAHTLKSSSLTMGVARLAEFGRVMEAKHTDLDLVGHYLQQAGPYFDEAREALSALFDSKLIGDPHE